jgi:hypothetical protein
VSTPSPWIAGALLVEDESQRDFDVVAAAEALLIDAVFDQIVREVTAARIGARARPAAAGNRRRFTSVRSGVPDRDAPRRVRCSIRSPPSQAPAIGAGCAATE